jgi:hypothetical protein
MLDCPFALMGNIAAKRPAKTAIRNNRILSFGPLEGMGTYTVQLLLAGESRRNAKRLFDKHILVRCDDAGTAFGDRTGKLKLANSVPAEFARGKIGSVNFPIGLNFFTSPNEGMFQRSAS